MQHDAPQALGREKKNVLEEEEVEPHLLPFVKKQKLFKKCRARRVRQALWHKQN
jgi:hypothetical protein